MGQAVVVDYPVNVQFSQRKETLKEGGRTMQNTRSVFLRKSAFTGSFIGCHNTFYVRHPAETCCIIFIKLLQSIFVMACPHSRF